MDIFKVSLIVSTFFCSLVAGFLFAYAVVIMPGIKKLNAKAFIQTFQVTDLIIQNKQPLFMLIWLGSAVAIIVCAITGFSRLHGVDFYLLACASVLYIVGVQISTAVINLPLNNKLQTLNVDSMDHAALAVARKEFEPRWNTSNRIRTAISGGVSLLLLILLLRL